jgi:hypothetical protein
VLSSLCGRRLRMKAPAAAAAPSAFERFLQLAGDFVGRGIHRALHDYQVRQQSGSGEGQGRAGRVIIGC